MVFLSGACIFRGALKISRLLYSHIYLSLSASDMNSELIQATLFGELD